MARRVHFDRHRATAPLPSTRCTPIQNAMSHHPQSPTSNAVPATMRAAVLRHHGGPNALGIEEADTPRPVPGHVLVRILAAGVQRIDLHRCASRASGELGTPEILGSDAAGEIVDLGMGVAEWSLGDRVLVMPGGREISGTSLSMPSLRVGTVGTPSRRSRGCYAEYASVPVEHLCPDASGLPAEETASLPTNLGGAVRSLKTLAGLAPHHRVLVHGVERLAGGMGLQVAKALGATVAVTTRSGDGVPRLRELGADLIVDLATSDLLEVLARWTGGRGVDVNCVYGLEGGLHEHLACLGSSGTLVLVDPGSCAGVELDPRDLVHGERRVLGCGAARPEELLWGLDQVRLGRIHLHLESVFRLEEVREAHRAFANPGSRGAIVLQL